MSVYLDDLTAGTSLTVVDARPIENSSSFVTDPTVSVDPSQLTMGHTYNARVVTKRFPAGRRPPEHERLLPQLQSHRDRRTSPSSTLP